MKISTKKHFLTNEEVVSLIPKTSCYPTSLKRNKAGTSCQWQESVLCAENIIY